MRRRMEEMVRELLQKTGAETAEVCVGSSALDLPADDATTALFTGGLFTPGMLDLQSDAYAALMGFTLGEPGVIVICGTGSMLVTLDRSGQQHVSGGWGYLLDDAGSSYTLAREALLRAIDFWEGQSDETPLAADALAFFGCSSPRGLIDRVYAEDFTPDKLAAFARCVLQRAREDDPAALEIVARNMRRIASLAAAMVRRTPEAFRVGLYGGVFQHNELARRLFGEELVIRAPKAQVCPVAFPPELGAVIHLMKKHALLNDDVLQRMKLTYEEIQKHECH